MKLTEKQENFAMEFVRNGGNATQAYKDVYDVKEDRKPAQIWSDASRLRNKPKVAERIFQLRVKQFGGKILDIKQRKEILSELALNGDVKALAELNKMDGAYKETEPDEGPKEIVFKRV